MTIQLKNFHPRQIGVGSLGLAHSILYLNIDRLSVKQVLIESAYGLDDLVVEVGSSLGLWLGLSALGLFDIGLAFAAGLLGKLNRTKKIGRV